MQIGQCSPIVDRPRPDDISVRRGPRETFPLSLTPVGIENGADDKAFVEFRSRLQVGGLTHSVTKIGIVGKAFHRRR
jgi:hypothetical protein